jgi:hypothetical protein
MHTVLILRTWSNRYVRSAPVACGGHTMGSGSITCRLQPHLLSSGHRTPGGDVSHHCSVVPLFLHTFCALQVPIPEHQKGDGDVTGMIGLDSLVHLSRTPTLLLVVSFAPVAWYRVSYLSVLCSTQLVVTLPGCLQIPPI